MQFANLFAALRSELHGVLAWYCCVYHLTQYYGNTIDINITPYSDNSTVIEYQHNIINGTVPQSSYLDDHDCFLQLQHYHTKISTFGITIHPCNKATASKTTNKPPVNEADTLLSQMDKIARTHRESLPFISHLPIPIDRVHLQDFYGDITSNEKEILATQWTLYRLELYYCRRWNITQQQLSNYDWKNYYKTYNKASPSLQIFMVKLLTGWLPVYHRMNKLTKTKRQCPNCQNDETIGHIFQCDGRKVWRQQFFNQLQAFLQKKELPMELRQEITHHFTQLLTTIQTTTSIKNYSLFAGLLPLTWTQGNKKSTTATTPTNIRQSHWVAPFCQWLTQQGHEAWLVRNKQIHNNDDNNSTIHTYLNQRIQHLYQLQHEIGYHDREMFQQPIEDRYDLPEKQKMTWIENTTKTMKVSMEEFQRKQTTGQKDIRQFFTHKTKSQ